jgi:hypothetical protein
MVNQCLLWLSVTTGIQHRQAWHKIMAKDLNLKEIIMTYYCHLHCATSE